MTSQVGRAAELIATENFPGLLPSLTPAAIYSQLGARGLRLNFDARGIIRVPSWLPTPMLAGDFVGEGQAIPANRLGLTAQDVGPPKKSRSCPTSARKFATNRRRRSSRCCARQSPPIPARRSTPGCSTTSQHPRSDRPAC